MAPNRGPAPVRLPWGPQHDGRFWFLLLISKIGVSFSLAWSSSPPVASGSTHVVPSRLSLCIRVCRYTFPHVLSTRHAKTTTMRRRKATFQRLSLSPVVGPLRSALLCPALRGGALIRLARRRLPRLRCPALPCLLLRCTALDRLPLLCPPLTCSAITSRAACRALHCPPFSSPGFPSPPRLCPALPCIALILPCPPLLCLVLL